MNKKTGKMLFLTGFLVAVGVSAFAIIRPCRVGTLDLENIPSTVSMDNISMTLDVFLWRDFMPTTGSHGHPLMCALILSSNTSTDIFSDLIVTDFWATTDNATWHRYLWPILIPESDYRITNTTLTIVFRNGPDNDHWDEGVLVDVVIKVRYNSDVFYLQSPDVPIMFTF